MTTVEEFEQGPTGLFTCIRCGKTDMTARQKGPHKAGHTRQDNAKYIYDDEKDPQHKHPLVRKHCAVCEVSYLARTEKDKPNSFCSTRCSQLGENNTQWKGDEAGYLSFHQRVYRLRGTASSCVWGCESYTYDWANLTGHYEDPDDYASMCRQCHKRYDEARLKCEVTKCQHGHVLDTNKDYYVRIDNDGVESRQCKQCGKDRARDARANKRA